MLVIAMLADLSPKKKSHPIIPQDAAPVFVMWLNVALVSAHENIH